MLDRVQVVLKTDTVQVRVLQNTQVEIRLLDAGGCLRAWSERHLPAAGIQDVQLFTASGFPATIQPGDSVVVTPEGEAPVVVRPAYMDVRLPVGGDTLFLEGPPDTDLGVEVKLPDDILPQYFETTTDEQGHATLDLADIDLRPGATGRAFYEPAADRLVLVSFQPPTVVAKVGSDWIEGIAWAEREVSLTVEDGAGQPTAATRLLATRLLATRLLADGKGHFSTRLAEEFAGLRIQPDHTIHVAWEDQELTLPVPELSARADPGTDQVTGRAPAGAELSVTVYDQAARRRRWYNVTADASGRYALNLAGSVDINPDDDGSVIYKTAEGHQLVAEFRVPRVELEVGGHRISGRGAERAGVSVELVTGDGTTKATAQTTVDTRGDFAVELEAGGEVVPVMAGDTVSVTVGEEQVSIDVPALTVHLDPDQERVTGHGPPGQLLEVSLAAGEIRLTEEVTPDADGVYSLDARGRADIQAGARATVNYTTANEHTLTVQNHLAQVTVQAGTYYIRGTTDPETAVDVRVYNAGGQLKDWAHMTASQSGGFSAYTAADCRTPVVIQSGDVISVTTPEEEVHLTVPELAVELDAEADRLTGAGPPGATVKVNLSAGDGSSRDTITVGEDGRFSISYAPDIDVGPGDSATVSFSHPAGHETFARANVPEFSAAIGGAVLRGAIGPLRTADVALRDGQGALKAETTVTGDHNGDFGLVLRDEAGQRVPIEAGDGLEVEAGGTTYRLQVPPLMLTIDPAGPTVSGATRPDTTVTLIFVTHSRFYVDYPVTADSDGHFAATFDPAIAIQAGDWVSARISTPEGFKASTFWKAPKLIAHAGTNYVEVDGAPRTPVTVTLQSEAGALRATAHSDPDDEEDFFFTTDGQPVTIEAGDRITLEQAEASEVTTMTVPALTVALAPASSAVHGVGPAGGTVFVTATGTGGEGSSNESVPVWADGTYTARLAGLNFGPGASASVAYTDPETGHRTIRETYRGWFRARIGGRTVEVRADPLSEVTLTLRGARGATKSEVGAQVDHRGRAGIELEKTDGTPAIVQAGDQIELLAAGGATELTVPQVSLSVDVAADRVVGVVPEFGATSVTLSTAHGCTYDREPAPAPDGRFQADFSPQADIGPGDRVTLRYTTPAGHELEVQRAIHGLYLPLIAGD